MDKITIDRISKLHPLVRMEMQRIIETCNSKLTGRAKVRISQGLRTFAEQDKIYAQGRTLPGKIVTNAKGNQSIHCFGFAVDIVLIIDGKEASWDTIKDWDGDSTSDWNECVKVFKSYGWAWGGDFKGKFKDMPHFDKVGFNDWKILSTKKLDKNNYIII